MNKTLNTDFIVGVVFAIIGAAIIILTGDIKVPTFLTEPGPRLFPYISGAGILICGIGIAFTKSEKKEKKPADKQALKRLLVISGALVLYYIGLHFFGFIIATPFASFAFIKILGCEEKVSNIVAIIITILVTWGLYTLFNGVFKIFLPSGILF